MLEVVLCKLWKEKYGRKKNLVIKDDRLYNNLENLEALYSHCLAKFGKTEFSEQCGKYKKKIYCEMADKCMWKK